VKGLAAAGKKEETLAGRRLSLIDEAEEQLKQGLLLSYSLSSVVDPDPGSGSVLDPYSIGSVDPDPYWESGSGSGSRRAKMTHKSRQYG
jgi:hypothetical protein